MIFMFIQLKRVITHKNGDFIVHRLIDESSNSSLYQRYKRTYRLKMCGLAVCLILFFLITVAVLAFGISSIKSISLTLLKCTLFSK
jgi:hypothetical protein